jgi:hypothetical protein
LTNFIGDGVSPKRDTLQKFKETGQQFRESPPPAPSSAHTSPDKSRIASPPPHRLTPCSMHEPLGLASPLLTQAPMTNGKPTPRTSPSRGRARRRPIAKVSFLPGHSRSKGASKKREPWPGQAKGNPSTPAVSIDAPCQPTCVDIKCPFFRGMLHWLSHRKANHWQPSPQLGSRSG